jgi:hypothetical protein
MASYTVQKTANKTLSTTVVDDVTVSRRFGKVAVTNRDPTNVLWVTVGTVVAPPAAPVANTDEIEAIPPNTTRVLDVPSAGQSQPVVKVLGSGGGYSVSGR